MGKLRRKIFWGSMAFFFAFLLWEGGRHGLRQVLRELEETHRIVVRVERTVPLFLGFALRGVRVSGEGFAFQAPEVSVRLSWNRGISAVIEDGEFAFSSGLPWSALESLPPLFVEVRRARLSGQNLPPWDGWLEKSGTVLRFGIAAGDLEARGTVEGGKAVLEGKYRTLPFWGSFVPAEGRFEGELGEGSRRVHLEGILSRKTQGWELSPLQVDHGGLLFSGRLFRGDDGRFVLSGRVRVLEEDIDVSLQGSNTQTSFEGNFEGKSATSTLSGRFRADLWNSSFLLEFAPQSVWRGVRLSGRLEGSVDDGLRLNFYDLFVSPEEGCTLFPVRGSGRIQGEVKKRGELWQGEIAFSSPEILIDRLGLQGVSARIALDGGRVTFSGSGHMLGGNLELSGSYESGVIQASGRVQGITLEGILEQSGVPLSGTFSGDLSCTGRVGDFRLVLRLTNGSLSWQGVDLGSIAGGEVLLEGERVEVRNLLVTRGSGKLSGNVTRDASGIRGKGEFAGYPLEVSWKGKTAGFILWGSVALEWGKEHCLGLSLSSPSWFFGNLQGRDLSISGAVRGKEITLNFLALQWDGGYFNARGRMVLDQEVDLSGEIENLRLPDNDFRLSGMIHRARFAASGPWERVSWKFEGEGSSLRILNEPLGERVVLKFSGVLPLSSFLGGEVALADILNPETLSEGAIVVERANLALLGGSFLAKALEPVDFSFVLDPGNRLWHFRSGEVVLSFPPYGDFRGRVAGVYDGRCFVVETLEFSGSQGIRLSGKGTVDTLAKTLDLQCSFGGEFSFPFEEFVVELGGSGMLHLFGDYASPVAEGSVTLQRFRVLAGGREYLSLQGLQGDLAGGKWRFSGGKGTFLGGELVVRGEVSREGLILHGTVQGDGAFLGLEGIFQGRWSGELMVTGKEGQCTLEGDLVVREAVLDTRGGKTGGSSYLDSLSQVVTKIPFPLKLRLSFQDTLMVKTDFLQLALSGSVLIRREGEGLVLSGRLNVLQGTYDLIACSIPLEGYIVFTELDGFTPRLCLEGRKSLRGYDLSVHIAGPLDAYTVAFSSEPPLSQEEILSLLFLGDKDAYVALNRVNLAPFFLKIARFLLKEDFSLSLKPLFDGIAFDPENFSRITFEKKLGKNVAFGYTQNLSNGGSAVEMNIDFGREWSLKLERTESGETEWMLQFSTKF